MRESRRRRCVVCGIRLRPARWWQIGFLRPFPLCDRTQSRRCLARSLGHRV